MALLLESLRLENYRAFRHFEIARLGRANLFVGRNNSGKSSILEAVRLYVSRGAQEILQWILESHDELSIEAIDPAGRLSAVKQLFHGRDAAWSEQSEILIGPADDVRRSLAIRIAPVEERHQSPFWKSAATDHGPRRLGVVTEFNDTVAIAAFDADWRLWSVWRADAGTREEYVPPSGLTANAAARLWDAIALTDFEQNVIDALRIISPDIERISFIGEGSRSRVPVAKLVSQSRPVALRSLGDGVNRILGIVLSLVSARNGALLLDEVENGIHFTAQQQLWQMIFRLAHRLDIQVFATTHSWDCIEAFQQAAARDSHEEAALVRLDVQNDAVLPTTFSERDLAIVTREQIEVR